MSIYENPEDEIERITKAREALSEELTDLLNWKQKRQDLVECEKDGHIWVLTSVKSDLWKVQEIHISCPRCDALFCALPHPEDMLSDTVACDEIGWAKGLKAIKDLYGQGAT
tara:strand:+ start:127 stop:462 length:336 start_codon:yes stop_codon:yes gene_type:complete